MNQPKNTMKNLVPWMLVAAAFVLGGVAASLLPRAYGQTAYVVPRATRPMDGRYQLTLDTHTGPQTLEWLLDTQTGQIWVKPVDYNLQPKLQQGWKAEPPITSDH